jgi:hypothetical protein
MVDETKTRKPLLFQYFLEFDQTVDCALYKEGFMINLHPYTLSQPIDATHIIIYEDSLEETFELEEA